MKAKETRAARGESPFIMKMGASPIPSPIMKACVSSFITKAGMSHIPNIDRRVLQRNISVSYAPYKIVAAPDLPCSCPLLTVSFSFYRFPLKILR
jgi:hypothetical protein